LEIRETSLNMIASAPTGIKKASPKARFISNTRLLCVATYKPPPLIQLIRTFNGQLIGLNITVEIYIRYV